MTAARILAVDDEEIVRSLVSRALTAAGFGVETAPDAEAALVAAVEHRPDLIVSDVEMPGASGLELCRRLPEVTHRTVPVILLSALSAESDILAGFDAGAVDYLVKPFSGPELVAKVRLHLRWGTAGSPRPPEAGGEGKAISDGRVRLGERIGVGGMGAVYRGQDVRLDRTVAVKLLRPDMAQEPEYVLRFLREARVLSRLDLPGVPRVHDMGQDGGTYYYVMDLLDGETLADRVEEQGPRPWSEVAHIGAGLTRILAVLEEHGMVHRDIKPENVLLTAQGEVGLVDFGLALGINDERLTAPDAVMGTIGFIPPEQILEGTEPDVRGDLYSVGQTLVFALRGRRPAGDGLGALMASAKAPAVELTADEAPGAPAGFRGLIADLTAPHAMDRPRSAADALARFAPLADAAARGNS